jgi:peptidoglycan/xylan/chitin deacetylase (PgdA/CDA1 family)
VGLLALPLSVLPFGAYATMTPEGRLLRAKVTVALSPPTLPRLSAAQVTAARAGAPRYRDAVMSLVYHGIGSASDNRDGRFVLSPERFGEHLATLRAAGMHAVTARQVAAAFAGGPALPPNAVMITFDDGRADAVLYADPLLEQARMRATMFVITEQATQPGVYYASWDRLEAASRSGRWDLQSHTASLHHEQRVPGGRMLPSLTSLGAEESVADYRARVRNDLARASAALQAHTGVRPVAFAYPFGAYGADRTNAPAIRAVLRDEVLRQYRVAFHQDDQLTVPVLTGSDTPNELRRLEVGDWSGPALLARIRLAARMRAPAPSPSPSQAPVVAPPPAAEAVVPPPPPVTAAPAPPAPPTTRRTARTVPPVTYPAPGEVRIPPTPLSTPTTPTTVVHIPSTSPPTTAPPANCGGQAKGKPCKH